MPISSGGARRTGNFVFNLQKIALILIVCLQDVSADVYALIVKLWMRFIDLEGEETFPVSLCDSLRVGQNSI